MKRARRPARLDYTRVDGVASRYARWRYQVGDWVFVGSLLFLGVTGFLLEALRIAETDPSFEKWSPVGWVVGQGLIAIGVDGETASAAHFRDWWVHGIAALTFVAAIPFTKAVHMMSAPASVATRDDMAGKRLVELPPSPKPEEVGYGVVTDLTPAHLLQLDACTKCGKCHDACPAAASGYPLSPRDLVLDLREQAEGTFGIRGWLTVPPLFASDANLLGNPIRPETVWSCMQCMACVEICPVGIEHVPIINHLRRRLVDRGEMDAQLQSTLETIYESGNSFGEPKRKRGRWAKELEFEIKDARKEPVEILWFVGDFASLDPRNIRVTQALARILHHAGVDFGILYEGERNAGNDVRRAGEEGLFVDLAESNIEAISACDFDRILTSDPHSFNTLKNEYPALGGTWDVVHHSQFLLELFASGALTPGKRLGRRVTYHDPCTLGPLQRRLRRAARADRGDRLRARRDAAGARQLVLLRRRRRPDLDVGAEGSRRAAALRVADARGDGARPGLDLRRLLPEGRDDVRGRGQDLGARRRDRGARDHGARARVTRAGLVDVAAAEPDTGAA